MNRLGRYQLRFQLGQGAMSTVYLAKDPALARLVAVKVLHPHLISQKKVLQRFFQEAKAAARVRSPSVVEVYDFGQERKLPYLVMEFIDGQSLQGLMAQMEFLPMDQVVASSLICQAAEGLAVAAEYGIVHRDIKPDNLMVGQNGRLKITDFGIAHLKDHTLTSTGAALGSPRYMSPEQVKGMKPITPQSDLFSLGSVLYFLLTGRTPFDGESMPALFHQIVSEPHKPLHEVRPDIDPHLARVVESLLDKDPSGRGAGPRELQRQLRKFLLETGVSNPINEVEAYMGKLAGKGIHTTSAVDPESLIQLMASLDESVAPRQRRWPKAALFASIPLGLLLLGGAAYLPLRMDRSQVTERRPELHPPAQDRPEAKPGMPSRLIEAPKTGQPHGEASAGPSLAVHNGSNPIRKAYAKEGPSRTRKAEFSNQLKAGQDKRPATETQVAILTILSSPPFMDVFLDGNPIGQTPIREREIVPGRKRLFLESGFSLSLDTILEVRSGPQIFRFSLLPNPEVEN